MLTFLPAGFTGLVLAGLLAAYMSTISTHLNWGAAYLVNDFYKRFVRPDATEKQLVGVGRITTVILMFLGAVLGLAMSNALRIFGFIRAFGAGTGLVSLLRWLWWRINDWCEIDAMLSSVIISSIVNFVFWPATWESA